MWVAFISFGDVGVALTLFGNVGVVFTSFGNVFMCFALCGASCMFMQIELLLAFHITSGHRHLNNYGLSAA